MIFQAFWTKDVFATRTLGPKNRKDHFELPNLFLVVSTYTEGRMGHHESLHADRREKLSLVISSLKNREQRSLTMLRNEGLELTDVPLHLRFLVMRCGRKILSDGKRKAVWLTNREVVGWNSLERTVAPHYTGETERYHTQFIRLQNVSSIHKNQAGQFVVRQPHGYFLW